MTEIKTDFKKTLRQLQELSRTAPHAGRAIIIEFAQLCAKLGKTTYIIPKRTGNLRSTSRAEITNDSVLFVTGGVMGNPRGAGMKSVLVNYAKFVNDGTSRQSGQYFMERLVKLAATRKNAIFRVALDSWLKHTR